MKTSEIRKLIEQDNLMKFYKGKAWMKLRIDALERDHHECQLCKRKGKYRKADCVHHIKEVRDHPYLALTLNNLMSVCNSCHNKEHGRDSIWEFNRKEPKFMNEERW